MPTEAEIAQSLVERLNEKATIGELRELYQLLHELMITTANYMIADWGSTDEAKKKEAIDRLIAMFTKMNAFRDRMTPMLAEESST